MSDGTRYIPLDLVREKAFAPCQGEHCPLCEAGNKPKPQIVVTDDKGKKYQLSSSLSEKIWKILEK